MTTGASRFFTDFPELSHCLSLCIALVSPDSAAKCCNEQQKRAAKPPKLAGELQKGEGGGFPLYFAEHVVGQRFVLVPISDFGHRIEENVP